MFPGRTSTCRKARVICLVVVSMIGIYLFLDMTDPHKLQNDTIEVFEQISQLNISNSESLMYSLGLDKVPSGVSSTFPVIVTGSNSLYFSISQGLIKSIHTVLMPVYPDIKLIYYDLGLTTKQSEQLRKYCKCDVRKFPFELLPEHFKHLKGYAFKPIAIKKAFQEFGNIWWLDSSIRFLSANIGNELTRLQEDNVLFFTDGPDDSSVVLHTRPRTFEYFHVDPMSYRNYSEIQAGLVAFRDSLMSRAILKQWVACSLIKDCIEPPGSKLLCSPVPPGPLVNKIGFCQRYDQSVLNILLRMLFTSQNVYRIPSSMTINRKERVHYFPDN